MLCNQCRFSPRAFAAGDTGQWQLLSTRHEPNWVLSAGQESLRRKLKDLQCMPPSLDSYNDNKGLCHQDSHNDFEGQSTGLLLDVWERNGFTNLDNICERLFNVHVGNLDFILCFFGRLSNRHLILVFDNNHVFSVIKLIYNIVLLVLIDCQLFF